MMSKSNCLSITAAATFLCATSAFAQENHGIPERVCARRLQALRWLHSEPPGVEHYLRQNKSDLSDACRSV
jgi:hypothetical protein